VCLSTASTLNMTKEPIFGVPTNVATPPVTGNTSLLLRDVTPVTKVVPNNRDIHFNSNTSR